MLNQQVPFLLRFGPVVSYFDPKSTLRGSAAAFTGGKKMASLKKRGDTYFAQYYVGKTQKRINLYTDSLQIAKEQLRQPESALYLETDIPLPSRTPLNQIVKEYVDYLFTVKTDKNAQKIISYLRHIFAPLCPKLKAKIVK